MSYLPRTPNYPRDNNNAFNTIGSQNHNANAQNHNNNAFNRNSLSYTYNISVTINNTSNEIEERSAIEIARRIPETLSPPWVRLAKWEIQLKLSTNRHISRFLAAHPNPESILREATIHQRQEWVQVQEIADGLGPNDPYNGILERFQTQGGRESRLPLTDGTQREITIAVMGATGNTHTCLTRSGLAKTTSRRG